MARPHLSMVIQYGDHTIREISKKAVEFVQINGETSSEYGNTIWGPYYQGDIKESGRIYANQWRDLI